MKILANTGLVFFTSFGGFFLFDSAADLNLQWSTLILPAVFVSAIQAAIAFFREYLKNNESVKNGVKQSQMKGYVTMLKLDSYHWHVGLFKTLKDRKICWKTKLFALVDCMTL